MLDVILKTIDASMCYLRLIEVYFLFLRVLFIGEVNTSLNIISAYSLSSEDNSDASSEATSEASSFLFVNLVIGISAYITQGILLSIAMLSSISHIPILSNKPLKPLIYDLSLCNGWKCGFCQMRIFCDNDVFQPKTGCLLSLSGM